MRINVYPENVNGGCHSSTVVVLPDGNAFVTWFEGTHEGHDDVAIKFAICEDGAFGPSASIKVKEVAHWNPVAAYYNGRINLFFQVGSSPRTWTTWLVTGNYVDSTLIIWDSPREVGWGPVKNKPVMLSNGNMIAGLSYESYEAWLPVFVVYTQENKFVSQHIICNSERPRRTINGVGMIQPTIWESDSNPGHVHAIMRTNVGVLYRTVSTDYGITWETPWAMDLPSNNSGIDLVKRLDGTLVMVWNPIYSPNISGKRRGVLSLIMSDNNGLTWTEPRNPDLEVGRGEYSYPAIIEDDLGRLHITYTLHRKNIVYWTI